MSDVPGKLPIPNFKALKEKVEKARGRRRISKSINQSINQNINEQNDNEKPLQRREQGKEEHKEERKEKLKAENKNQVKETEPSFKSEHIKEVMKAIKNIPDVERKGVKNFVKTGIEGFDELLEKGIPQGSSVLLAGGTGSGKTIFGLQLVNYHASHGENCLYMSFEESESRLTDHMKDFGWDPDKLQKNGFLKILRVSPFDITRSVDALLMKAKGELLIEVDPVILPDNFKPDFVVVDSLSAIASAFTGKDDSYRIYIEQLFRFFEKLGATSFLITETEQVPTIFSTTGVEEFLADGVVVLYSIKRGNVRENAIEVLKLRGAKHDKKIVAMQITSEGVVVYPEQEVFGEI